MREGGRGKKKGRKREGKREGLLVGDGWTDGRTDRLMDMQTLLLALVLKTYESCKSIKAVP